MESQWLHKSEAFNCPLSIGCNSNDKCHDWWLRSVCDPAFNQTQWGSSSVFLALDNKFPISPAHRVCSVKCGMLFSVQGQCNIFLLHYYEKYAKWFIPATNVCVSNDCAQSFESKAALNNGQIFSLTIKCVCVCVSILNIYHFLLHEMPCDETTGVNDARVKASCYPLSC